MQRDELTNNKLMLQRLKKSKQNVKQKKWSTSIISKEYLNNSDDQPQLYDVFSAL